MEFSLLTPQESGYYLDPRVDEALDLIRESIDTRTFSFIPKKHWNFYEMQEKIASKIEKFGWSIKSDWIGSKDDGHCIWRVEPK